MSPARTGVSAVAARQETRIATRDTRRIVLLPLMFRWSLTTGDVFALIAKVVRAATAGQYDRRAWRPRARGVCPLTAAQHRAIIAPWARLERVAHLRHTCGSSRTSAVSSMSDRVPEADFASDYVPLLRWLIFTGVSLFGVALAWHFGLIRLMLASDKTHISAAICAFYLLT